MVEIYGTEQGKNKTIKSIGWRLKELLGKMYNHPIDDLKKRLFVEGFKSSFRKKMNVVLPTTYANMYN